MKLILISNLPDVSKYAFECGVDRIMVDTETLGKRVRQSTVNAVFNEHSINDIIDIKNNCFGEVICRINPINRNTLMEIDSVVHAGADYLMVPMIRDENDIKTVLSLINGRIKFIPLLETASSIIRLHEIIKLNGISELYFGLNDISIQMKLEFLHEITSSKIMRFCSSIIDNKLPFGFGGIARIGEGAIPAELILSEHYFCDSTRVILGRAFHNDSRTLSDFKNNTDLRNDVQKLKLFWNRFDDISAEEHNRKLHDAITNLRNEIIFSNFKKDN